MTVAKDSVPDDACREKHPSPAGLANLGSTCFANSVLQCLTFTPPLASFCTSKEHSRRGGGKTAGPEFDAFAALEIHVCTALEGEKSVIKPSNIIDHLKHIGPHFQPGRQEDAHEFCRQLMEGMHKADLHVTASPDAEHTSVVHSMFGGRLRSRITCRTCGTNSDTPGTFLDLSLEVKHADTITGALQGFTTTETLDGPNMYMCSKCAKKTRSSKRLTVDLAPSVLTIHLKRFDCISGSSSKITKHVKFEEFLSLDDYMSEGCPTETVHYQLYAVLVHSGDTNSSGHYKAFIKTSEMWYEMNDETVKQVLLSTVKKQQAYMLFYIQTPADVRSCIPESPALLGTVGASQLLRAQAEGKGTSYMGSVGERGRGTVVGFGGGGVTGTTEVMRDMGGVEAVPVTGDGGGRDDEGKGGGIRDCMCQQGDGDAQLDSDFPCASAGSIDPECTPSLVVMNGAAKVDCSHSFSADGIDQASGSGMPFQLPHRRAQTRLPHTAVTEFFKIPATVGGFFCPLLHVLYDGCNHVPGRLLPRRGGLGGSVGLGGSSRSCKHQNNRSPPWRGGSGRLLRLKKKRKRKHQKMLQRQRNLGMQDQVEDAKVGVANVGDHKLKCNHMTKADADIKGAANDKLAADAQRAADADAKSAADDQRAFADADAKIAADDKRKADTKRAANNRHAADVYAKSAADSTSPVCSCLFTNLLNKANKLAKLCVATVLQMVKQACAKSKPAMELNTDLSMLLVNAQAKPAREPNTDHARTVHLKAYIPLNDIDW